MPSQIRPLKIPLKALVTLDYETEIPGLGGSVEYHRPDFRVKSAALSYQVDDQIENRYFSGETEILLALLILQAQENPIVVHNFAFEYGVTKHRFPNISLNWKYDTMRLAQVADNGGSVVESDDEESYEEELDRLTQEAPAAPKTVGLSLQACISRWLPPEFHNHKKPFHDYLHEVLQIDRRKAGANLHLLPEDMLIEYNTKDSELTLRLCETLLAYLASIKFDHSMDHYFYLEISKLTSDSRGRGVVIDRDFIQESITSFQEEFKGLENRFHALLGPQIAQIEKETLERLLGAYKTEKGRNDFLARTEQFPELYKFKINSTAQKTRLFKDLCGIEPTFLTKNKGPSFKRSVLGQWGEGGLVLKDRGSISIAQNQAQKLYDRSQHDGRWHIDISAAGTTTGRMKGAGGLNVQGMARREPRLMKGVIAEPGKVFVSVDLQAGEPSITAHFSQDPYYKAAILDMVGKAPYYDQRGVLMIDDIYLMGMSVSPMGKEKLRYIVDNQKFNGISFSDQWLKDSEIITKGLLKKDRDFHKILILGIGYAMGPKKMVESAFEKGFTIKFSEAKNFVKAYQTLFKGVTFLSKQLEQVYLRQGSLVNPFGYRLLPDPSYKAFNYFIQSSVNGIITALSVKFFTICPEAEFITVIHDEIIMQLPETTENECKRKFDLALESLNEDLGWSVKIRCGWKIGRNFYDAK